MFGSCLDTTVSGCRPADTLSSVAVADALVMGADGLISLFRTEQP
jgi:hypothetical protein